MPGSARAPIRDLVWSEQHVNGSAPTSMRNLDAVLLHAAELSRDYEHRATGGWWSLPETASVTKAYRRQRRGCRPLGAPQGRSVRSGHLDGATEPAAFNPGLGLSESHRNQ